MMDKIKEFFSNVWAIIVLVLGAVIGGLVYYINLKNKQANALKAKIELAETQKQADLLEVEIKQRMENKNLLKKEVQDMQNALDLLEEKRKNLPHDNMSSDQILDILNKKDS